jgi:hypothetical protein
MSYSLVDLFNNQDLRGPCGLRIDGGRLLVYYVG